MAKLFLFMMVSVDGYFEGENHDLSWHNVDDEFVEFAVKQTSEAGTILFGRRTYEMMAAFWPSEHARTVDPKTAELMNNTPKIVFSKSLQAVPEMEYWKNITLKRSVEVQDIKQLKASSEKDIAIYGSNNLCVQLMQLGLVDEFRIMINPVAIAKGTPVFLGLPHAYRLTLKDTRTFKSGNVLLRYVPQ